MRIVVLWASIIFPPINAPEINLRHIGYQIILRKTKAA